LPGIGRRAAIAALTATLAACGSDPAGPSNGEEPMPTAADTAAGLFALTAVDAAPLPATILTETGYTIEVTAGTADLDENGALIIAITTRETVAGFPSIYVDSLHGTWTQTGTVVRLTIAPGSQSAVAGWDGVQLSVGLVIATAEGNYVFTLTPRP
jgi:hypothetical protein